MIINLIATPRNVSTALMYSFAQHPEIKVMDEPFYAYYLTQTSISHPGGDRVLKELPSQLNDVFHLISTTISSHPVVFIKNMAHHLIDVPEELLSNYINVFLTRDPKKLIASFSKVMPKPTINDIGVQAQWERFEKLLNKGNSPVIIDSGELLKDPKSYLTKFYQAIGLTFDPAVLSWQPGGIEEDGSWTEYWYASVHKSTGFGEPSHEEVTLNQHCQALYEQALPFYHKLSEHTIKL